MMNEIAQKVLYVLGLAWVGPPPVLAKVKVEEREFLTNQRRYQWH